MQKPLKPIMTEEELDIHFDKTDEELIDISPPEDDSVGYEILVTGLNYKKEENGYYWRSNVYKNPDDAVSYATLLDASTLLNMPKSTKELLVEVYSTYDDVDEQKIYSINLVL